MPTTAVVNLRQSRYHVYIGRSRRGQPPSKWGNPFPTGRKLTRQMAGLVANHPILRVYPPGTLIDRAAAIALFRARLETQLADDQLTAADFLDIQGKTLGCFCKPQDCHGDVIAEFCEWFAQHPEASTGPPEPSAKAGNRQRVLSSL